VHHMRLRSLSYEENLSRIDANPWKLDQLFLEKENLIIAKNATGKTRILGVIISFARLIQGQVIVINGIPQRINASGSWKASLIGDSDLKVEFSVSVENGVVLHENIVVNGKEKLRRDSFKAEIYSEKTSQWQSISPPGNCLVAHIRRDKAEFPFLEYLVSWAEGVRAYSFANTSPLLVELPENPTQFMSLNAVPSILDNLSGPQVKNVLRQLNTMHYSIEGAASEPAKNSEPSRKIIHLRELGLNIPLKQFEISQGMFRAFSLLVILEHLRSQDGVGCVLVDDLGEGLDFDRSQELAKIIFSEENKSNFQFIATTNDASLINAIPLNDITVCYRSNHEVNCMNHSNAKDQFENWEKLGLNNFDLLSSNFLSKR